MVKTFQKKEKLIIHHWSSLRSIPLLKVHYWNCILIFTCLKIYPGHTDFSGTNKLSSHNLSSPLCPGSIGHIKLLFITHAMAQLVQITICMVPASVSTFCMPGSKYTFPAYRFLTQVTVMSCRNLMIFPSFHFLLLLCSEFCLLSTSWQYLGLWFETILHVIYDAFWKCRAESVVILITCQEKKVKIILTAILYGNRHKHFLTDRHKQKYV